MSSSATATSRSAVRYLIAAAVLLALVIGLGLFYYLLTRPPQLSGDQGPTERTFLFSIYGFQGDLLRRPTGVAVDSKGNIHVADTGKKRIVVFDAKGNFVTTYGDFGNKPLQLWEPIGVAVAPDGRSYVVDKTKKKIVIFDSLHRPFKMVTFQDDPLSVSIANDNLFVTTASGVMIGDFNGNLLTGYIARGKKEGQFDLPGAVAVGKDGTLYVADSLNYRVQAIGTNGKAKWVYGKPLPPKTAIMYRGKDRKFGLPASIAADDQGNIYVVDGLNSQIVILDSSGQFVETMGDLGHDDGQFYYPEGIAYADGRLVVADKFNDRVEVFSLPSVAAPAWRPYAPLALLLLLLPLALLFLRRGRKYVATPAFVSVMAHDANGAEVAAVLGRVNVTPDLAQQAAAIENISIDWRGREVDAQSVRDVVDRFDIGAQDAAALLIAVNLRGKRVLLAEDEGVRRAASELGISTLTYEEMSDALDTEEVGLESGA